MTIDDGSVPPAQTPRPAATGEMSVDNLSKSYNNNPALHSISLSVKSGEFVTLLGPSGCGKTTTLNAIAGFIPVDDGSIVLDGEDITNRPPYARNTAMVFQQYALFPHLRVFDNVAYGLKIRKLSKADLGKRVAESLKMVGIEELADRFPAQLSGGQQQRVAVARAVAVMPAALLMDEPLSNLDAKLREEVRWELRTLQQRLRQTVVFVTHDQQEALSLSDRVVVMSAGQIEQVGSPIEVYASPRTVFVADFMGVSNIFEGRLTGDQFETTCGHRFAVPKDVTADPGQLAAIGFRPSGLSLVDNSRGQDSETAPAAGAELSGRVVSQSYLGEHVRTEVQLTKSHRKIRCDLPTGIGLPPVGTDVRVDVQASSMHFLNQ